MSGEKVTPYGKSENKKRQVAHMFNNIAPRYDFLNHFLSLGIDRYWRKAAINKLKEIKPRMILDVATGTADLAVAASALNPAKIYGVDLSSEMLGIGRKKVKKKKLDQLIQLLEGDSEELIFESNKFDAVTVGFGVRNFENLERGLSEIHRVLAEDGMVVILEFSHPSNPIIKRLYNWYSSKITPKIGGAISKDSRAYSYLHESVSAFPSGENFVEILRNTGFRNITFRELTMGIVTIYTGRKN